MNSQQPRVPAILVTMTIAALLAACGTSAAGISAVPSAEVVRVTPSASPDRLDTSAWTPFSSTRHGLTMAFPASWKTRPAKIPWNLAVDQSPAFVDAVDRFLNQDETKYFAAYGMPLPRGMTYETFIAAYQAPNVANQGVACHPPPTEWAHIKIDGRDAGLVHGCGYVEAQLLVDGRVYVFSAYRGLSPDRDMIDAFLSTVRFHAADADDRPADPPLPPS